MKGMGKRVEEEVARSGGQDYGSGTEYDSRLGNKRPVSVWVDTSSLRKSSGRQESRELDQTSRYILVSHKVFRS